VHDDEAHGQQEDQPVLVERERDQEDEEEEVRLGQAVGEMDGEGGGGQEAESDRDCLETPRYRVPAAERSEEDER
jgi:hypothetical protein